MPCDMQGQTEAQKAAWEAKRQAAKVKLERELLAGRVKLIMEADGTPRFDGWAGSERSGWHDACAYRALMAEGSSALRMAQARQQPDRMQRRAAQ